MTHNQNNDLKKFQLRPLKPAKISEISEATTSSPILPEERVNFHIGNPVEDERLLAFYQNCVLGSSKPLADFVGFNIDSLLEEDVWTESRRATIDFICRSVKRCVPYMPRGGFHRKDPGKLADDFLKWLIRDQQDPLSYDLGKDTGRKEVIFASGGIHESVRVILQALSTYMLSLPARVFFWQTYLPDHLKRFPKLNLSELPSGEEEALEILEKELLGEDRSPLFLWLGAVPSETFRRQLRHLSRKDSLFFMESSNAPNHLSLAREAGLSDCVLRVLTPSAIDPRFSGLSLCFIIGNADFLKAIEAVHFELKGTPSAAEVELVSFLLGRRGDNTSTSDSDRHVPHLSDGHDSSRFPLMRSLSENVGHSRSLRKVERIIESNLAKNERLMAPFVKNAERLACRLPRFPGIPEVFADPFLGRHPAEIVEEFFRRLDDRKWPSLLGQAFLGVFLGHHPQYEAEDCMVVSGSARTAMSLLGFHCGIREIITPDLSWTYEHCFPKVATVPLTESLSLDREAIKDIVEKRLSSDPSWIKQGAVILNNPHNASGQAFGEEETAALLVWLLRKNVLVIDDLSYENVGPSDRLEGPKTLRQTADRLVKAGRLRRDQTQSLITVHSLSKTDCFAGARLSVVEIRNRRLQAKFRDINATVQPDIMAVLLAYLFYRNDEETVRSYWTLRNRVLEERMRSLENALLDLPPERNPFGLDIRRPKGSMYPQLVIQGLPAGISLDWLSSGLAKRGIGLIPLTTFARLELGFDLARKSFRLTLGGADGADVLARKTRRVLIDLNRIIADESTNYMRKSMAETRPLRHYSGLFPGAKEQWDHFSSRLIGSMSEREIGKRLRQFGLETDGDKLSREFLSSYMPDRMGLFRQKFQERLEMSSQVVSEAFTTFKPWIVKTLEQELYKETLEVRKEKFRQRLFDRTVHPTQAYALRVETAVNRIIDDILSQRRLSSNSVKCLSDDLLSEFLGTNVPIRSPEEGEELVTDLQALLDSEEWARWQCQTDLPSFLSFWGDWDGSTRPSGQGHRLVAAALLENVTRLSRFLEVLINAAGPVDIDPNLVQEVRQLDRKRRDFWGLLNQITSLTNQLEGRYLNVLPFNVKPGAWRRIGMRLHLARDPVTVLWQHNDRLEGRMLKLRQKRRKNLEYYFLLNKRLRKTLYQHLDLVEKNLRHPDLAYVAGRYKSMLHRFALTPRIHQKMIISLDQFAIDTTVHNITELNEIAGKYGNPGMVMALQVSFSTDPEAFISLERKLRSQREEVFRTQEDSDIPSVWVVPLFEDLDTINNLKGYCGRLWEYAVQSRRLDQTPADRFAEMVCELFIAGSDLSQQVSQPAAADLYKQAKQTAVRWFAEKSLIGKIRIKLGSGEPMQRQGGYYDPYSGRAAVIRSRDSSNRLEGNLKASTKRSTQFAVSPLRGIQVGGEFRTFQSNLSERLRSLSSKERAQLLYHISESQKHYERELVRAAEPLEETRLSFEEKGYQELGMLTRGTKDELYDEFLSTVTRCFRQILYGREEDVVGIHAISYFISRSMPVLRDRPVVRPSRLTAGKYEQRVVERLAQTLPLAKHGSLLRAIGHNRAQTMILGVNQLSTGLFRALNEFKDVLFERGDEINQLGERILLNLPVQDILHTLRLYHEPGLKYLKQLEAAFPAGNSAFLTLREDIDSLNDLVGLLQKEFLRRQGLSVSEFFSGDKIVGKLLPALRPDIAVLLQPDLFNTDDEEFRSFIDGPIPDSWMSDIEWFLELPLRVRDWRQRIWQLIGEPVSQQVKSFVELALAIDKLSTGKKLKESLLVRETAEIGKLGVKIADLLRGAVDDPMRQFLSSAVQYLVQVPQQMEDVPIEVIRALRDVEQIVRIEKQALGQKEQDLLRFYIMQIARLCGENG
ncbi:MAG: pyridoxal phosphate-dependent aminotransferase [Candidatus Aminicenantes bacterium]|nr:pyridoxal phosphate-dependent aminotransferase [Candidatus Aminicenantes bacterium]